MLIPVLELYHNNVGISDNNLKIGINIDGLGTFGKKFQKSNMANFSFYIKL